MVSYGQTGRSAEWPTEIGCCDNFNSARLDIANTGVATFTLNQPGAERPVA